MSAEAPFNSTTATNKWQRAIDRERKISIRDLFNMGLDIIKMRADEAGVDYISQCFDLLGPKNTAIQLAFFSPDPDKPDAETISITLFGDGEFNDELLEITKKGEKGSERFYTYYGHPDYKSMLLGDEVNKEGTTRKMFIEPHQRAYLAKLLWAAHLGTPDEEFMPDDEIGLNLGDMASEIEDPQEETLIPSIFIYSD